MRVISGKYKGKTIKDYNEKTTRPTSDRVKESLFSMIQNDLKDAIVLDLFAGSGSLGIESLSNGSKECYFVEKDKVMFSMLKNNIASVGVEEKHHILNTHYLNALECFSRENIKFDIIYIDPPYDLDIIQDILDDIIRLSILDDDGLIICEYSNATIELKDYELIKEKKYGPKNINIFKIKKL